MGKMKIRNTQPPKNTATERGNNSLRPRSLKRAKKDGDNYDIQGT